MQLRCSKSCTPIVDGKTRTMYSTKSKIQYAQSRLLVHSDLESHLHYIFLLISHTSRTFNSHPNDISFSSTSPLQSILKGRHSTLWDDSRFSVFRERVRNKSAEGAHCFRSLKVRPPFNLRMPDYDLNVQSSALGYVPL